MNLQKFPQMNLQIRMKFVGFKNLSKFENEPTKYMRICGNFVGFLQVLLSSAKMNLQKFPQMNLQTRMNFVGFKNLSKFEKGLQNSHKWTCKPAWIL